MSELFRVQTVCVRGKMGVVVLKYMQVETTFHIDGEKCKYKFVMKTTLLEG